MRLHRISDEQWRRLVASRRAHDLETAPARTEIGAIEIELRKLRAAKRPRVLSRPAR
jgi:hypothetical protein